MASLELNDDVLAFVLSKPFVTWDFGLRSGKVDRLFFFASLSSHD